MRTSSLQVKSKLCGIAFINILPPYMGAKCGMYQMWFIVGRNLYPYSRYVPRWGGHSGNLADNIFGQDTHFYSKRLLGLLTRCANGVAWIFSASG